MKKGLLIVEDNPEFQKAALQAFPNAMLARDYCEAMQITKAFESVLTDCFFPYQTGSGHVNLGKDIVDLLEPFATPFQESHTSRALEQTHQLGYSLMKGIAKRTPGVDLHRDFGYKRMMLEEMALDQANQPLGIQIGQYCDQNDIPFALVTSTYHHDSMTEPINRFAANKGWLLVDCPKDYPQYKAQSDFWKDAFERMEWRRKK
ncbi:MAG: hypothetical protein ACMXYF_01260 [Candidatus Woesearchaeota archaeon]